MLIATGRLQKKPLYEIHDIRQQMLNNNITGACLRLVEKYLIRRTDLLIVTSEDYIKNYYKKRLNVDIKRSYNLENKLWPQDVYKDDIGQPTASPLIIGYFGLLRCTVTWQFLVNLVKSAKGSILLKVRGIPQCANEHNVKTIEVVFWN